MRQYNTDRMLKSPKVSRVKLTWQALRLVAGWCIAILLSATPVRAAISLSSFQAAGRDNQILLTWVTETEYDSEGFVVWSSEFEDGTYNPISEFIQSTGAGPTGATYTWSDESVPNGVRQFYKLEAIALDQSSEFYGPISAVAGLTTPTITRTLSTLTTASPGVSLTPTLPVRTTQPASQTTQITRLVTSLPSTQEVYPYPGSEEFNPYPGGEETTPSPGSELSSSPTQSAEALTGTPEPTQIKKKKATLTGTALAGVLARGIV